MRTLVVTTFFPNSQNRQRTIFVANLVRATRALCNISVIAPVPYVPPIPLISRWSSFRRVGAREEVDGIEVLHPRFLVLPKVAWFSGIGYFLGVLGAIWRNKRQFGPCVIHVHCAYPDAVGVALAARVLRLPYVVTAHGSDINVYATHKTLRSQIRWALKNANGVIAVSEDLAAKIRLLTCGAVGRLECIPCAGFNPELFFHHPAADTRTALGLPTEGRIIVFVGTLVPIKGVELLVDAWINLAKRGAIKSEDRLVIVGEGTCRHDLEQRALDGGSGPSVRFTGALPQATVSDWISAASLLCLPSHNEGTPNVVVEALASGIPVVATRVGGVPELLREGQNGLLVTPGNSPALADALEIALTQTWDAAQICRSVEHLTWKALAARNCRFIESVVNPA